MTDATIRKKIRELYRLRRMATKAKALQKEIVAELEGCGVWEMKPTRKGEPGLNAFVMESDMKAVDYKDLYDAISGSKKNIWKALKVKLAEARKIFGKDFVDGLATDDGIKKSLVIKADGNLTPAEAKAIQEIKKSSSPRRVRI